MSTTLLPEILRTMERSYVTKLVSLNFSSSKSFQRCFSASAVCFDEDKRPLEPGIVVSKYKDNTVVDGKIKTIAHEELEVGYPLLTFEWENLQKRWADERDQFRKKLEQAKPVMIEPTQFQRKIVVWSGMYTELSAVPDKLNLFQVKQHGKSLLRRAIFMILVFYCSLFYIYRCDDTENKF